MRRKNENTKNTRVMQFCFSVLFVFLRVLRFVAIIRFLWCHSFFVVVSFFPWCCSFFRVVHCSLLFVFSAVFVFFRGVVRFFRVIRFSVLSLLPRCSFFRDVHFFSAVREFSVLLVFCGVIRFSVQCGGFPRSSFFRVVRLRRVPVPYVRLLATPLPYVRLFFSRDTTLGTCNFSSRVHGEARALRRCQFLSCR